MSWPDILVLALRGIRRRPARTILTAAAIALGAALLTALATIAQVADTRIIAQLGKGGPATAIRVVAAAPDLTQPDTDQLKTSAPKDLDQPTVDRIARLAGVRSIVPVLASPVFVVPPPRGTAAAPSAAGSGAPVSPVDPFMDSAVGVGITGLRNLPITLLAGRTPAAGSLTEAAVTFGYLDRLHLDVSHPERVLGSEVELGAPQVQRASNGDESLRMRWSRVVITGVVAQEVGDGDLLVPIELTRIERGWGLAGVIDREIPLPTSDYSGLIVVASDLESIHSVRAAITALGYATGAPEHLVATVQKYLHVVDIVLGAIGIIALVIAALGIADAMLAAVRERRREIGVVKAIGGRDRDVLGWFVTEAVIVGAGGGLIGGAMGIGVAGIVGVVVNGYLVDQGLIGVDLGGVPWTIVALGVAGSALLALIAAAGPALRAARLPAREAVSA